MQSPQKNSLIVFYGGIGDILLWIPALKAIENKPDVIFLYGTPEIKILQQNKLVRNVFIIKNKSELFAFVLTHFKLYQAVFLNHLCGGSFLMSLMSFCSKGMITNSLNYLDIQKKNLLKRKVLENVHDSLQNYYLVFEKEAILTTADFSLTIPETKKINLPSSFIAVQLGAGNNQTPYKNWPIDKWNSFFELLIKKYPNQKFVFLGHRDEEPLFKKLNIQSENFISLTGKTSIDETFEVISKSDFFLGPDGGLMHVAVCCGKPTFTIWGGSSPVLYAYDNLLGRKHRVVKQNLTCMPCNAWLRPNVSKTYDPIKCPDFICLHSLSAGKVLEEFAEFYSENKNSV